ncbi:carboxyl-terminal processing protease [Tamilnaduibacter salinus]|uniref:Carboxyl-terminal processing protease n=1 Tax=Tamilnaduibacter salinus TaxID=1484056 RepID=A0A2A2I4I8_9GAMM|nr:S41 family peptidase [Tamilnaduibacter salinus]PAV26577.1 peptidase S41 [Tamilnaduibacter salinus]PVY75880.1 carboxyl-terminal processing protease [Tamilnaduibacter salinus]
MTIARLTASALLATSLVLAVPVATHAAEPEVPEATGGKKDDGNTLIQETADGKTVEVDLPDPEKQLPLKDLRQFTEVFGRIREAYVEEVDDRTLLENAIKGMLSGLDPHSAYLAPKAYEELEESTSGEFGGLGIEVGMENGFVKVIAPIDGTPAQKAGVQAGDTIVKLGDQPVKGMNLEEAVNIMRGKPGTELTLTIVRESRSKPLEITVKRDVIQVTSIRSRMLQPGYGYLRVTQFQADTGKDFVKTIDELESKNDGQLDGLIIDLRNNPGGVLQAAVESADALLDGGLVVYTEGRIKSSKLRFNAEPGDETNGTPIVVLINGGSASASEILAGALQDHDRAVIMGTESFGKGSVQTIMPLDETHAIKLTTARYYTPDGRSIQAKGIHPDVVVRPAKLTELDSQPFFTEADLSGHLEGEAPEDKPANSDPSQEQDEDRKEASLLERDFQLQSALNLLQGLNILGEKKGVSTE